MSSTLEWLTRCPAHDVNFGSALDAADIPTLRQAVEILRKGTEKKTALKRVEGRLRKLEKKADMKKVILGFVLVLLASGCATIIRGSNETLVLNSEPQGASVKISNGMTCITPCSLTLPRRPGCSVTFEKEGYFPLTVQIDSTVSGGGAGGFAGNILFGGLIGAGVDVASGAMNNLTPNPCSVVLKKKDAERIPTSDKSKL